MTNPTKIQRTGLQFIILLLMLIVMSDGINNENYRNIFKLQGSGAVSILQPSSSVSNQYVNHSPIIIDGNADFITQASTESWPGNGTASAPYVIDGYNITGPSENNLIEIANTDAYFRVSNCLLSRGRWGVSLNNVTNGQISNNTVTNNSDNGLYLRNFGNSNISHNVIINNKDGIFSVLLNNCTISDNTVTNNRFGFYLVSLGNSTISANTIANNSRDGIYLKSSNKSSIWSNMITDNGRIGIWFENSRGNVVKDNGLRNNGLILRGENLEAYLQADMTNNSINGKPLVYWQNIMGGIVPDGAGQVILVNSTSVEVTNQSFFGVQGAYCSNVTITNNVVTNSVGLSLSYSENSTISYNTITNTMMGIYISYSGNSKISHNNVTNTLMGISISYSGNSEISHNTVTNNNDAGIWISGSGNNTIYRNTVVNNSWVGIYLRYPTTNNRIFLNNFFRNNIGGSQAKDEDSGNIFEFNFWDNWVSPDDDADGIVDSPYSISGSARNQDRYPLVTPESHLISLPVVYLSGGETLSGRVTIDWTASVDTFSHPVTYSVYYSEDNGTSWIMLATDLSTTSYVWDTTTVVTGSSCLVKVVARCSEGLTVEDSSDTPFFVHNLSPLKLLFPTGGEFLNSIVIIQWESTIDSLGHNINYTLYYSSDEGVTWDVLEEGVKTTSFVWDTCMVEDNNTFQIKVVAICSTGLTAEAMSASFTVHNDLSPPTVLVPTANTTLSGIVTIRWNASVDSLGHEVIYSLFYSSDDGDSWVLFASNLTAPNYRWNTFTVPDGNHYLIKVVATCSVGLITEATSSMFAIHNVGTYMWVSISLVLVIVFTVVVIRSVLTVYPRKKKPQVFTNHQSNLMEE